MNAGVRRWPLFLIAAPAAVSIWSGWVGLGGLCGFGLVQPMPGVLPIHINTALTLPLGIESYAALALGAWLRSGTASTARTFARRSALGSLVLGMLGQVSYHLLAAGHATRAPDVVVVLVSCLPVIVLGCAVALMHLLSEGMPPIEALPEAYSPTTSRAHPVSAAGQRGGAHPSAASKRAPTRTQKRTRRVPADGKAAEREFISELASGAVPSIRQIRARLHVGQDRAKQLREHLDSLVSA